ncbi:MAG: dTMP kinase [Burkholderiales bacterium]|nr:dTMP kinase [Burkholderiales bacterium]
MATLGKFISFEGIDGAGKSTHIELVRQLCEAAGKQVVQTREPGGTPLGEQLRGILLQQKMAPATEAMLMYAARHEHVVQVIQPALARGDWVISDRYVDSSIAYQGGGRALAQAQLDALGQIAIGDLLPDLTLLFDVPLEVAQERLARSRVFDKFEQEQADFFQAVRGRYLQIAATQPDRVKVVDASQSIEEIAEVVRGIVQTFLQRNAAIAESQA